MAPVNPMVRKGAALPTPVTEQGGVDWTLLAEHCRTMLEAGLDTLVPFGTTGEGASVPRQGRLLAIEKLGAQGIKPSIIVPCIYGPSADDAAADMARAARDGAKGVLLVPPFYFKDADDDGLLGWFARVFERAGARSLPTLGYHIPGVTMTRLSVPLVGRLREAFPDHFVGVKDSGGDWDHTSALLAEHSDLTILIGSEPQLAKAVREGASGTISGCINVAPALVSRLADGEDDARIDTLVDWVLDGSIVPNVKALMAARTGNPAWASTLPPLRPQTETAPAGLAEAV